MFERHIVINFFITSFYAAAFLMPVTGVIVSPKLVLRSSA